MKVVRGIRPGLLCYRLYSTYADYNLQRKFLKSLENGKKRGEEIHTLKCADDLVLLAKDETVLQIAIDEIAEVGRQYRMECGKNRSRESEDDRPPCRVW